MKFCVLFLLIFLSTGLIAQSKILINPTTLVSSGGNYSLRLTGEDSEKITEALFTAFPKVKRKKFSWKFKNVSVPEINQLLTFNVNQGITGTDTTGAVIDSRYKGSYYFHIFESYTQKEKRLQNKLPNENIAINVYIHKGKKRITKEEALLVEKYLKSIAEI